MYNQYGNPFIQFLSDFLFVAIVFIPLEFLFAFNKKQKSLHPEIFTDFVYFVFGLLSIKTLLPYAIGFFEPLFDAVRPLAQRPFLTSLPIWTQIFLALLVTDFFQYWIHRGLHSVNWTWEFHKIHHSSKTLNWLSGGRIHLFDIVFVHIFTFICVLYLGLHPIAIAGYMAIKGLHSVFIHSNVGFNFGFLNYIVLTPQVHHWHHDTRPEAHNKNFSNHFSFLDVLFGTFYWPKDRQPETYGIPDENYPTTFWEQFIRPFTKKNSSNQ